MNKRPQVGVGVIVVKDNKVLLGKRKRSHGSGFWAFPGGHLEFSESFEQCAQREVAEEVGIAIDNVRLFTVTNDWFQQEDKHYVTVFVIAEYKAGEVQCMEPEKCEGWEWFSWTALPEQLFLPIAQLVKQGHNPLQN